MNNITLEKGNFKKVAKNLKKELSKNGFNLELTLGASLNLLSRAFGYSNYNVYNAKIDTTNISNIENTNSLYDIDTAILANIAGRELNYGKQELSKIKELLVSMNIYYPSGFKEVIFNDLKESSIKGPESFVEFCVDFVLDAIFYNFVVPLYRFISSNEFKIDHDALEKEKYEIAECVNSSDFEQLFTEIFPRIIISKKERFSTSHARTTYNFFNSLINKEVAVKDIRALMKIIDTEVKIRKNEKIDFTEVPNKIELYYTRDRKKSSFTVATYILLSEDSPKKSELYPYMKSFIDSVNLDKKIKDLKINDIVLDLETSRNYRRDVLCRVTKIDDIGVVLDAIKDEDKKGYPHRFRKNDDAKLLIW